MQVKVPEQIGPLRGVDETAVYTDTSPSYLNRLRSKGGGPPFIKLGSRVAYSTADLDAWLAARRRTSTSDSGPILPPAAKPIALRHGHRNGVASATIHPESSLGEERPP